MIDSDLHLKEYSLGEALMRERKKKNIPLEEISKRTNINLKSLQALEDEEFHRIPGAFYLKNYIKSYLRAIGSDERTFFQTHDKAFRNVRLGPREKSKAYYSRLRYSRFKKKNVFFSVFLFLVLFAIVFAVLYLGRHNIFSPSAEVNWTAVPLAPFTKAKLFSIDYWPVRVDIEFLDNCWLQVHRGRQESKKKILEQVYQKGDNVKINGYELHFFIGNPSAVRFHLNNKEVTVLKNKSRAGRITITPGKVKEIPGQ
ncbi:MAG: DUF4115 domain-containing protein [Candidatus Aminicenantes bacterium]|nr:MAG: DUF4115 domain-containing protein [Candidatus Aminicenantes bacterium]